MKCDKCGLDKAEIMKTLTELQQRNDERIQRLEALLQKKIDILTHMD